MKHFATKVQAVRFHCRTGIPTIVDLRVSLKEGPLGPIIDFGHDGVTGYESYYLNDLNPKDSNGIWLNAGTRGRWDGLYLSQILFEKVVEAAKKAVKEHQNA